MGAPRFRMWMWLALGSVLVLGVSTGLLADRLFTDHGGDRAKAERSGPRHDARGPEFQFDCREWESRQTDAAADSGPETETEEADRVPRRFRDHSAKVADRLAERLELDPEQAEALVPVMEGAMIRSRSYWTTAREDFCAMQEEFRRDVTGLLRPEQAERFEEWWKKLSRHDRRHGGRHGDGHAGESADSGGCR